MTGLTEGFYLLIIHDRNEDLVKGELNHKGKGENAQVFKMWRNWSL